MFPQSFDLHVTINHVGFFLKKSGKIALKTEVPISSQASMKSLGLLSLREDNTRSSKKPIADFNKQKPTYHHF